MSIVAVSLMASEGLSEAPDAVHDTLRTVTVVADKGVVVSRKDIVTIQKGEEISGIINNIPGLSLSDYGSAAGLKAVSLRGMGAANTSVYIDGVRVCNVQNGQADLGFVDHANFSSMTVDYAQNSISFNTARPVFKADKRFNAGVRFFGGSFGTYNPSVRAEYMITDRLSAVANLSWYGTGGDFTYQDADGNTVRRVNNDLEQWRAGIDFFGLLKGGDWHAKAYFNDAGRGTPGPVTNPDNTGRQNDRNGFAQFRMSSSLSSLYDLNITAKAAFDNLDYVYSYGRYIYNQTEFQLNTSHIFHINDWWTVSAAAGVQWDGLDSLYGGAEYCRTWRTGLQAAVSSSFDFKRLDINLALLYNGWFDDGYAAEDAVAAKRNCLSPSMDFRLNILDGLDLVGFARRAYRVPTFNDLYYPGMGSTSLNPEDSWLTDLGAEYSADFAGGYRLVMKLDGFHYSLTNKITSMPDPNDPTGWTWLMYNIGKVHDNGLDVSLAVNRTKGDLRFKAASRYSFQNAIDRTPGGINYGKQVPYVARHTLTVSANIDWMGWKAYFNYNLRSGRNDTYTMTEGELKAWDTLGAALGKAFEIPSLCTLSVMLKASNAINESYEIIRYYPMPGRSFTVGLEITL